MKNTKQNTKDMKREKTVEPRTKKNEVQTIKCKFCPKTFSALRWNTGIDRNSIILIKVTGDSDKLVYKLHPAF